MANLGYVRHDASAQAETLHKIATAKTNRAWLYAAAGAVVGAAPDDGASQGTAYSLVVTAVVGQMAALPAFQDLLPACKGDALHDANRAQTCDAVATVLTDHPDNLMERLIGTAIGRNIGWSPDRVDLARAESHAFMTAPDQAGLASLDCGAIRAQMSRTRGLAPLGKSVPCATGSRSLERRPRRCCKKTGRAARRPRRVSPASVLLVDRR